MNETRTTDSGIDIKPVYTEKETAHLPNLELPGIFPYTQRCTTRYV
ncbi:MAG: hypothetical protein V9E96_02240 [Chitinophagaceae bacterium]